MDGLATRGNNDQITQVFQGKFPTLDFSIVFFKGHTLRVACLEVPELNWQAARN